MRDSLSREFTVKDLGDPKTFLGFNINRNFKEQTIELSQEKFITNMLKCFGFKKARPVSTPIQTNQASNHSRKHEEEDEYTKPLSSNTLYQGAVGSLLHLANGTHLDISYGNNVLSRDQVHPTESDWLMVGRVFQYLFGTRHYEFTFKAKTDFMFAYSDASLSGCKNLLTTCGYVIKLFEDSVDWRTHKQSVFAL